jgi:hypothetical protein
MALFRAPYQLARAGGLLSDLAYSFHCDKMLAPQFGKRCASLETLSNIRVTFRPLLCPVGLSFLKRGHAF